LQASQPRYPELHENVVAGVFQSTPDGKVMAANPALVRLHEFELRAQGALDSVQAGATHAACYLDLDQFKIIDDICGHIASDEAIRQLGQVLQRSRQRCSECRPSARRRNAPRGSSSIGVPVGMDSIGTY
jgi:hypothetical protein